MADVPLLSLVTAARLLLREGSAPSMSCFSDQIKHTTRISCVCASVTCGRHRSNKVKASSDGKEGSAFFRLDGFLFRGAKKSSTKHRLFKSRCHERTPRERRVIDQESCWILLLLLFIPPFLSSSYYFSSQPFPPRSVEHDMF